MSRFIAALVVLALMVVRAYAGDMEPTNGFEEILHKVQAFLESNGGVIGAILGFVIMAVGKLVPNGKAGPVIHMIQKVMDWIGRGFTWVGKIFMKLTEILDSAVKSNGFLGRD